MTPRPLAVYTDVVDTDPAPGIAALEAAGWDVRVVESADAETIALRGAGASALLIGYSPVNAELLEALPQLQVVATQSVGVDMVDADACRRAGVAVSNVPALSTEEVSAHALAFALAIVRGIVDFDRSIKEGAWDTSRARSLARPSTLTVGVLGLGRIGRRFAQLAAPIFREVIGYDPIASDVPEVTQLPLDEVLRRADILSLHLPLTPETHHFLGRERLALLPRGARVINVARGALIDPHALREMLESGHLAAAGLDVFDPEPPRPDDPLATHPGVIASPHAGFLSPHSARDYVLHQAENVIAFGRTGTLISPVVEVSNAVRQRLTE